ncbi:hypothetical protein IH574_05865 [Candidatus Bathyarchaeota archaeon]|nr:hypothetical protein [Candidatus Bathyarchaeota archaeon]
MSFTSTVVNAAIFTTIVVVIMVIYVTIKYRKGELTEKPGDLQFSRLSNLPGEDYVDLNVVKVGKNKTLASFNKSGFISWEAYFHPQTKKDVEDRLPATIAIIAIFAVGIMMTVIMKLMQFTTGYYFSLAYLTLASLLVLVKFIEFNVIKRKRTTI